MPCEESWCQVKATRHHPLIPRIPQTFYAFQWPFKNILVKRGKSRCRWTDDHRLWFRLFFVFVVCSPPPSSCKIGVWLNTCKLCCDYKPLKSSLKINLYIVKFLCLIYSPQLYFFKPYFSCLSHLCCVCVSVDVCVPASSLRSWVVSLLQYSITPADGAQLCRVAVRCINIILILNNV